MLKINLLKVIVVGDWNMGLSKLDKSGGLFWKEINYRNVFVNFMKELNFIDIYCVIYLSIRIYIYEFKSLRFKLRIDFFFVLK